jgi:ABC-type tungstate transport system permease subunit
VPFAERKTALWSELVLIGPENDPAEAGKATNVAKALQRLAERNARIIAPGQEPGINDQVERIWKLVGLGDRNSRGPNYTVYNFNSVQALKEAENSQGYTLLPLSVFINNRQVDKSKIVFQTDYTLFTRYEVTIRNYISIPGQDITLSRKFASYLLSAETQTIIANFKKDPDVRPYRPANYPVYVPPVS